MALTSTSPASSSDLWLKNKKKHFSTQHPLNQNINTSELRWITHTSRQQEGSCDWSASYHCRKAIRQADTPWGRRRYRHTMKFSPSSWGGSDFSMLHFHENQQVLWGSASRKPRPQVPWLCGEWKESPPAPPPGLSCWSDSVPSPRPARQPFSFKAAKYLIALTDVGLFIQRRLRGSSEEREGEVSKNKSNTDSQGQGWNKQQAGSTTYNHGDATRWQRGDRGSIRSHRRVQRERTPARGPSFSSQPSSTGWDLTKDN